MVKCIVFMPPTSKKLRGEGAYWFGPVHACVRALVTLCMRSRTVRDRISKFDMHLFVFFFSVGLFV